MQKSEKYNKVSATIKINKKRPSPLELNEKKVRRFSLNTKQVTGDADHYLYITVTQQKKRI